MIEVRVEGYPPILVEPGCTLLEACEGHGVPMGSACGGFAACNSCRVDVVLGQEHLSARLPEEEPFLDAPAHRLGCQSRVLGAVTVRLAPGG
jgi:ferredoxin, 2Fe-2S